MEDCYDLLEQAILHHNVDQVEHLVSSSINWEELLNNKPNTYYELMDYSQTDFVGRSVEYIRRTITV